MLMFVGHAATRGHIDVSGLCLYETIESEMPHGLGQRCYHSWMSTAQVTTEDHVDKCGLCCGLRHVDSCGRAVFQGSCLRLWSTAAGSCVHGPCCHQKPCRSQ